MKQKPTLTIAIPAYNEEANLPRLLASLAKQEKNMYRLEKVYIGSDGSTDKTVQIGKTFSKLPTSVIANKKRRGKASILNQIIKKTTSDVLVIIDADTYIFDRKFIGKLIAPIVRTTADLTSAKVEELRPKNFLQHVLWCSMQVKKKIFEDLHKGNNIYTCHGRSRGFSKRFYSSFRFENSAGEDAFSYLSCITSGYTYRYVKNASIYYQLPQTWNDHVKQSVRYLQHDRQFADAFSKEVLASAYALPKSLVFRHTVGMFVRYPIHMITYVVMLLALKAKSHRDDVVLHTWSMSPTSKVLSESRKVRVV